MKNIQISDEDYQNYINGFLSLKDFGKKYNVSSGTILNHLKKEGKCSRLKNKKKYLNEDFFKKIDNEEKAYILGFYIGDGYVNHYPTSNTYTFRIGLQEDDEEILTKIKNIMSPMTKLAHSKMHKNKLGFISKPMCVLTIRSKQIVETLEKKGLGYNKTYKGKTIKNLVPKRLMKDFIRGYFDADGCVSHSLGKREVNGKKYTYNNFIWNIISKDKKILLEIQDYFHQNNIKTNIYPDTKGCYLISLTNKKQFQTLYELLYNENCICMERKRKKFENILNLI